MKRIEQNFPGHFIGARECEFFLTTDCLVDARRSESAKSVRVSTVGKYKPARPTQRGRPDPLQNFRNADGYMEIGYGRYFETMVFTLGTTRCTCGCGAYEVDSWGEVDMEGYNTEDAARAGHEAMVQTWMQKGSQP